MANAKKDYFGLSRLVSLILAIIPFTAWLLGILTRFKEGHPVCALVRIFLGLPLWILDLVCMILSGHIFKLF